MKSNILFCSLAILLLLGCSKFEPSYDEINSIQSEWLLPIAKTSIGFKDINEISNLEFDVNVAASELGFVSNTPIDIPNFQVNLLGPYIQQLPPIMKSIQYDSLFFTVELINGFPITLGAGTTISYRNAPNLSDENLLFEWVISEPTPPGGAINFSAVSSSNYFNESVYIYIENFQSPGGNDIVFNDLTLSLSTEFEVIDLNYVDLYTGNQILSIDTLSISIEEPGDTFGVATGGTATIYFDNLLPAHQRFQAYFLDDGIIIDSLFSAPGTINGCGVDANGVPGEIQSTKAIAPLSWAKWTKLAKSDNLVIHHYLNTNNYPGQYIRANKNCKLDLQLVVDVLLNVNIGEL
ncbi:MAG: hypothetical protein ACK5BL_07005 [Flavobacteriales bacterium]|jgi:hypothetical protein